jgi:hypothetical protein
MAQIKATDAAPFPGEAGFYIHKDPVTGELELRVCDPDAHTRFFRRLVVGFGDPERVIRAVADDLIYVDGTSEEAAVRAMLHPDFPPNLHVLPTRALATRYLKKRE